MAPRSAPSLPPNADSPELAATKLLKRFQIDEFPVPVEEIARRLGLRIQRSLLGDDVAGVLLLQDSADTGVIGVNVAQAHVRQRFTIAHEIAHFVLHRHDMPIFIDRQFLTPYFATFRNLHSSTGEDRQEREANAFAAALLMPATSVKQAMQDMGAEISDDDALELLARRFDVSRQAMTFRVANLVLDDGESGRLRGAARSPRRKVR